MRSKTIYYKYRPESSDYSISLMSGKHKDRMPFKHLSEVEKFGMFPLEEGTSRWKSTYFNNVEDARKFITDVARWVDSFVTS